MKKLPTPNRLPVYVTAAVVLVVLLVASALYISHQRANKTGSEDLVSQATSSPSASNTAGVVAVSASPSSSSSTIPTATPTQPSAGSSVSLPDSATAFIGNFYAAYSAKDAARLGQFFTPDTGDSLIYLHAVLFTGKDPQGSPAGGGPTLFVSNNVLQYVTSYTVLGSAPQGKNWIVTVSEKRSSPSGNSVTSTTLLTLVPAPSGQGTWLLDAYVHAGANSKYDGFFID